jgi:hypothetical protein
MPAARQAERRHHHYRARVTWIDTTHHARHRQGLNDRGFVVQLRQIRVAPHGAAKAKRSAIDRRTTRHAGYQVSQRNRKLTKEPFGWRKFVGPPRKTMLRGIDHVGAQFTMTMAAYNRAKLPRLIVV